MDSPEAHKSGNVVTFSFDVKGGWRGWFLLMSDVHYDAVACRRDVLKRHLERLREQDGYVLDAGDFFDAMNGRFDPRRDMENARPEYRRNDYYDAILTDAVNFLSPYARRVLFLARGNHELSVLKNANTDLTARLAKGLGSAIAGEYSGWIRLVVKENGYRRGVVAIHYRHGMGAGAPVTRGVIETNRQAVYLEGVDVVWNGHNHQGYMLPIVKERLTSSGRVQPSTVWFVRTPGYKDEWHGEPSGYVARKGTGPTPLGSVVLKMELTGHKVKWSLSPWMEA